MIERLKSGDVPPGDFKFEDMRDPQAMLRPDALSDNRATNLNLYPKKRELEKQVTFISYLVFRDTVFGGQVVKAAKLQPRDRGLESWHHILDGMSAKLDVDLKN